MLLLLLSVATCCCCRLLLFVAAEGCCYCMLPNCHIMLLLLFASIFLSLLRAAVERRFVYVCMHWLPMSLPLCTLEVRPRPSLLLMPSPCLTLQGEEACLCHCLCITFVSLLGFAFAIAVLNASKVTSMPLQLHSLLVLPCMCCYTGWCLCCICCCYGICCAVNLCLNLSYAAPAATIVILSAGIIASGLALMYPAALVSTHVLGVLVQGLLLSCVQLLSMRCCCMFWFGNAVAHVTVVMVHVLLHSAGVAAAVAIAVHSTWITAVKCAAAHCCVCTCCCIRCYHHVCICPTKGTGIPFVAFGVIAVAFIVVAACAIAYALPLKG